MSELLTSNSISRTTVAIKRWQRPTPCWCGGYWFPHRTGGGACDHSKTRDIHLAIRHGDDEQLLEALTAHAFEHPGRPFAGACPF